MTDYSKFDRFQDDSWRFSDYLNNRLMILAAIVAVPVFCLLFTIAVMSCGVLQGLIQRVWG